MADLEVQGHQCSTDLGDSSLTNTHSSELYPVENTHTHKHTHKLRDRLRRAGTHTHMIVHTHKHTAIYMGGRLEKQR